MTAHWRPAASRLVSELRSVFGDRLRSIVAYGPQVENGAEGALSCLALVTRITISDLEACAHASSRWQRDGVGTPLLLPEPEFRQSLDAFPLEYGEILRVHELLYGDNPFDGVTIDRHDLRRACETQIKSHLVHLREGYIESGGTPRAVNDLVTASSAAFGALLRNIARVNGCALTDRTAAAREGARLAELPETVVAEVLSLERPAAVRTSDSVRLFPDYLLAVEQLARFIDTWDV